MHTRDLAQDNKTGLDLPRLFEALDERSRAILWYMWWHRHAQIPELASLVDAASDYEVLSMLKEVINGKARELWGRAAVSFEESKTDPITGEKVLFNWWLLDGEDVPLVNRERLLVDVFDAQDTVTIIAQLPGWDSAACPDLDDGDITPAVRVKHLKCRNGVLQISLEKGRG